MRVFVVDMLAGLRPVVHRGQDGIGMPLFTACGDWKRLTAALPFLR
jgi:hypothetical protein